MSPKKTKIDLSSHFDEAAAEAAAAFGLKPLEMLLAAGQAAAAAAKAAELAAVEQAVGAIGTIGFLGEDKGQNSDNRNQ